MTSTPPEATESRRKHRRWPVGGRASVVVHWPGSASSIFSWVVVGPLATRMLADLRAEVIKVEHRERLDVTRRLPLYMGQPPRVLGDEDTNPDPNRSEHFNNLNRNKLSVTINMTHPRARDVNAPLVASADAVSENFSPGIMESWGLTYELLCAMNSSIVYLRMSGFGHSGPYRSYKSYGPIAHAVSGLNHIGGLPGREPSGIGFAA